MKVYDYYITPEEYKIAESNGISRRAVNYRIREAGWSKERAITEPLRRKNDYGDLVTIAINNGIQSKTFYMRVRSCGWDPYKAATVPTMSREESVKKSIEKRRKYPQEILELAESNGISHDTFRCRVRKLKWDLVKAATTPIMTQREIGLLRKEKLARYINNLYKLNNAQYMERCNTRNLAIGGD
ncbi:hypothetical protein [Clostridium baratii]|uniref:hypothetical protein n=1 Tax=Clostridium baratii TaxID=1561 RepID=UPI0030CFFD33